MFETSENGREELFGSLKIVSSVSASLAVVSAEKSAINCWAAAHPKKRCGSKYHEIQSPQNAFQSISKSSQTFLKLATGQNNTFLTLH